MNYLTQLLNSCFSYARHLLLCWSMLHLTSMVAAHAQTELAAVAKKVRGVAPGYSFTFPRDHGSHPQFGTEWWYFSGQLNADGAESPTLGFQLTFFRRNQVDNSQDDSQLYLAHAALSDFESKQFVFDSRRARGGPLRMAYARTDTLDVAVGRWRALLVDGSLILGYEANTDHGVISLNLLGALDKEPVLHGEGGFSRKGACSDCASLYYSVPHIVMRGEVVREGKVTPVSGIVWMDHEFMDQALRPEVQGWDWFSLQVEERGSLMLFRVRHSNNNAHFFSGTWMPRHGDPVNLSSHEFSMEPEENWVSPQSKAQYPVRWRIRVPIAGIETSVNARFPQQELYDQQQSSSAGPVYWEGAVSSPDGKTNGYLEMTGYHKAVGALF